MMKFFKKNKNQEATTEVKDQTSKQASLENIEFRGMPDKFKGGAVHSPEKNKVFGIILMTGGAIVIVIASVFLFQYLFNSPSADPKIAKQDDKQVNEIKITDNQEDNEESEEVKVEEKNCGIVNRPVGNDFNEVSGEAGLQCLGERIKNNCSKTELAINTADFGYVSLTTELVDSQCQVKVKYPAGNIILNDEFKDFAGTSVICNYDIDELKNLQYNDTKLAHDVYTKSNLLNINEDTACQGTAISLWQELQTQKVLEATLTAGVDSDDDGLTDVEENYVFVSDISSTDTDSDTYFDGAEVINLYSPVGNEKLESSGLVRVYKGIDYNILYPRAWRIETDDDLVHFFSEIDGFIQVMSQENPEELSLDKWYYELNRDNVVDIELTNNKSGLSLIYSENELTAYLVDPQDLNKIYIITYSPGNSNKIEFKATFQMMVNSFVIK